MKKILTVLAAVVALASGMIFTGCELEDELKNAVGPSGKWCEKDFEYKGSDEKTTELRVYMIYNETEYSNSKFEYKNKNDNDEWVTVKTLPAGLTLVAVPKSGATPTTLTQAFGSNRYAIKTFAQGKGFSADGEEAADGKFKMSYTLWGAVCFLNPSIPSSANSNPPDCVRTNSDYTQLTDFSEFNWKKITAQILVDKLLTE